MVASRFGDEAGGWTARLFSFVKRFAISPAEGADTIVYLASSPDVAMASGEYFAKRKVQTPSRAARDDAAAAKLWEKSEAIAAMSFAPLSPRALEGRGPGRGDRRQNDPHRQYA